MTDPRPVSLTTSNGILEHADIAGLHLSRDPITGDVELTIGEHNDCFVTLTPHEVRLLAHALDCARYPYGGTP